MTDSVEKCLIEIIDAISDGQTRDHDGLIDHNHFITDEWTDNKLGKIRDRLKKLGESNDIHSKTG